MRRPISYIHVSAVSATNNKSQFVVGDGNCLYRAAPADMYGTESYHVYFRLVTACEMLVHGVVCDTSDPQHAVHQPSHHKDQGP